jgi:hypothetical protein
VGCKANQDFFKGLSNPLIGRSKAFGTLVAKGRSKARTRCQARVSQQAGRAMGAHWADVASVKRQLATTW